MGDEDLQVSEDSLRLCSLLCRIFVWILTCIQNS